MAMRVRITPVTKAMSLFVCAFALVSCTQSATQEVISLGFDLRQSCLPAAELKAAIKCKREQSLLASFDVYFGAMNGFEERWNEDGYYDVEKSEGACFALLRRVYSEDGNIINTDCKVIEDFPNDEKYKVDVIYVESFTYYHSYGYFQKEQIDFSSFAGVYDKGYLIYAVIYYDKTSETEIPSSFGSEATERVYYEIGDSGCVTFSANKS